MTGYVIWTRGLSRPEISVLRGRSILTAFEREHILSGPTPIAPEHAAFSLTELAKLYPPPQPPSDPYDVPEPRPLPQSPTGAVARASEVA